LGVATVKLVAHDWGGPVAFIMMLRHPEKVTGSFGVNTVAPYVKRDLSMLRNMWRFWYQIPMALPVIGPRVISDPKARFSGCWHLGLVADSRCPTTTSACTSSA
jgi:pimeloyl-ACP methyl ester carboxylesterase